MKAIIVSNKFNPGHFSHLIANYKLLVEYGYSVSFRWNLRFDSMLLEKPCFGDIPHVQNLHSLNYGDLLIVWFPSISALFDILFVRAFTKARVVYVYHEPFESTRAYLNAGFDIKRTVRIILISYVNRMLAYLSHRILLPSKKAFNTYQLKYHTKKPYSCIPLMFDDESTEIDHFPERRFISYIGTIAADHAFDKFVNFVEKALCSEKMANFDFLIATRSSLDVMITERLKQGIRTARVKILDGVPLSNQTINDCYAQSWVVWNAYLRSMQSGVLPKAYMFGTPVLISELNRSEFFVDGRHGVEISSSFTFSEIESAILNIQNNFTFFTKSCKDMFNRTFHYKAVSDFFMKLVL